MRDIADEALDSLLKDAILDGYAHGHHQAQANLAMTGFSLRRWMSTPRGPNPNYAQTGEMAQALVVMAALLPEAYKAFVEHTGEPDARTYAGFLHLSTVIGSLGDDHDYMLDTTGRMPALKFGVSHTNGVVGANPSVVLAAVAPMIDDLRSSPAP